MEAESDKLRNAYKTAVIIGIAMMGSVLVYVVVAELMRNLPTPWKGIMFLRTTKNTIMSGTACWHSAF